MKPYYEDDAVTIYHGDALDTLDALAGTKVDAVVTDPPYASGARTEQAKRSSGQMLRGARFAKPIENDQMTTAGFVWLMRNVAYRVRDMLPEGGSLLSFIDWRQWPNLLGAIESVNLRVNTMVVWDKAQIGMGHGFRQQHELVMHASRGVPTVYDRSTSNVLRVSRERSEHPSPKPIEIMERLLRPVSEPGHVVLDPFMGGGATLLAAANSGRRAIGIEIEERYCEMTAARRCAQEVLELAA